MSKKSTEGKDESQGDQKTNDPNSETVTVVTTTTTTTTTTRPTPTPQQEDSNGVIKPGGGIPEGS